MSDRPLRVIHCGTGVAGLQALRAILSRDGLQLAGLLIHGEKHEGADAATVAGSGAPCGVLATRDFDTLLRTPADVVCYMLLIPDVDQICALLASGKSVVTTAGLMLPGWHSRETEARLQQACREGGSSFYVTGINPGWVDEILPLTMSALTREIRHIHILEYADCSKYPAPHILSIMGFGRSAEDIEAGKLPDLAVMREFFTQSLAALAQGLGVQLDRIEDTREYAFAARAYDIAAGHIPAGGIAGQRWRWTGSVGGQVRIVQETYWITAFDLGAGWPASGDTDNDTQWRVTLEGSPSLRCTFQPRYSFLGRALETVPDYNPSGLATAMAAVNSLAPVSAAGPGLLTSADLPLPRGRLAA
ncbi:hypothetical protein D0B54_08480 [Solimonas sp. K1W22B-7]|uniref:NAD(P)H-dependent amine dehydrogenase family protein n=1 Tax=Solimonas sp. K1W22B-7 TaxID=2303331 RepID=UPI000E3320D5|nr:hypothetical protein [Solimonas sp. K1W22B-7]AXQ28714.1 hypothetical protein D0B54_08480 [Solimonas sp. K1W22B-7]